MYQIVVEIDHLKDEESEDNEYGFKVEIHLVGGDSSCKHEVVLGKLFAVALNKAQDAVMEEALLTFIEAKDKDKHDHRGNGHEKGETLH